jgi:hypothetical protein
MRDRDRDVAEHPTREPQRGRRRDRFPSVARAASTSVTCASANTAPGQCVGLSAANSTASRPARSRASRRPRDRPRPVRRSSARARRAARAGRVRARDGVVAQLVADLEDAAVRTGLADSRPHRRPRAQWLLDGTCIGAQRVVHDRHASRRASR